MTGCVEGLGSESNLNLNHDNCGHPSRGKIIMVMSCLCFS